MGWVLATALLVAGCGPGAQASHGGDGADAVPVSGVVLAGPVCPVESVSPDPSCADRPVSGAELVIEATAGGEVLRVTSGPDGEFRMRLAPGAYRLVPQEVEGLMGTAGPMDLVVSAEPISDLVVSYDTGIR
jgi:hypothetical protein